MRRPIFTPTVPQRKASLRYYYHHRRNFSPKYMICLIVALGPSNATVIDNKLAASIIEAPMETNEVIASPGAEVRSASNEDIAA